LIGGAGAIANGYKHTNPLFAHYGFAAGSGASKLHHDWP
jgi:hypothetical protein